MNTIKKQMIEINQLCNESDEIYHSIARSYGLTDSIYWILYILYNYDEPVSQIDLCNNWSYSKQTVNSSIAAMLKKEWITLEVIPNTRNKKQIVLTEIGKQFCDEVIGETQDIEQISFSRVSEEERELFISVFRKLNQFMQEEYEKKHSQLTD
ncbi:MAG: MarR family transcriptional regulator [Acetobacter sp.]|nr:MarR family transcriptional regulator [Bacteroides sp.]MCM1340126.1 MarR family transcriptional regulator [Acetobacter sp.]MCM1432708.1 MarR family transcriptional regulator [Clostridiales bacterium]